MKTELDRRHLLFEEYCFSLLNNPLSPKLANKQAIEDKLKSGCQRKPGKMLKMSTEGGQQN